MERVERRLQFQPMHKYVKDLQHYKGVAASSVTDSKLYSCYKTAFRGYHRSTNNEHQVQQAGCPRGQALPEAHPLQHSHAEFAGSISFPRRGGGAAYKRYMRSTDLIFPPAMSFGDTPIMPLDCQYPFE